MCRHTAAQKRYELKQEYQVIHFYIPQDAGVLIAIFVSHSSAIATQAYRKLAVPSSSLSIVSSVQYLKMDEVPHVRIIAFLEYKLIQKYR